MANNHYRKLSKHPLLFVLAEFRFPPIIQLENLIPDIQEVLRTELPYFEQQTSQEIQIEQDGINLIQSPQWAFIHGSRKKAVLVNNSRIVCVSSDYDRFDGFESFCLKAIEDIQAIIKPAFIERIGLRYADLIESHSNTLPVTDCVQKPFYAVQTLSTIGNVIKQSSEFAIETEEGVMIIRSLYGHHNISLLHDVNSLPIKINVKDRESERVILDFDHIWQAPDGEFLDFDTAILSQKLRNMHQLSRQAFWHSVTEKGVESWA